MEQFLDFQLLLRQEEKLPQLIAIVLSLAAEIASQATAQGRSIFQRDVAIEVIESPCQFGDSQLFIILAVAIAPCRWEDGISTMAFLTRKRLRIYTL